MEAGIPLEEAKEGLAKRRETHGYDDDSLRILASKALMEGMQALIRASKNDKGRVKAEGGEFGSTLEYADVEAAKTLVMAGLKMRGMLGGKKGKETGADDLFDRPAPEENNWTFPKRE